MIFSTEIPLDISVSHGFVWQIPFSGGYSAPEADTGYAAPGINYS